MVWQRLQIRLSLMSCSSPPQTGQTKLSAPERKLQLKCSGDVATDWRAAMPCCDGKWSFTELLSLASGLTESSTSDMIPLSANQDGWQTQIVDLQCR